MPPLGTLPGPVVALIGDAELVPITVGRSEATAAWVRRPAGRWVLKTQRCDELTASLVGEAERMRWLAPHVAVPEVVAAGSDGTTEWLVTTALAGSDGTDPDHRRDLEALLRVLGEGLRAFHEGAPTGTCPFDASTATALELARARVEAGRVDESRFAPLYQGLTAGGLFDLIVASRPATADDQVVLHGDYCVPNVIVADGAISGYVDLGGSGVGDRHRDLAIAAGSIALNFGGHAVGPFVEAYGLEVDLGRLDFFVMLDQLVWT